MTNVSNQMIEKNLEKSMQEILKTNNESFAVYHNSKLIYVQNDDFIISTANDLEFKNYSGYFKEIMKCISTYLNSFKLRLDSDSSSKIMSLKLNNDQMYLANDIREALLDTFPDDIFEVEIQGNRIIILDIFYKYLE